MLIENFDLRSAARAGLRRASISVLILLRRVGMLVPVKGRRLWLNPAGVLAMTLIKASGSVAFAPPAIIWACNVKSMSFEDWVTKLGANLGESGFIERLLKFSCATTTSFTSCMSVRLNVSFGFGVL